VSPRGNKIIDAATPPHNTQPVAFEKQWPRIQGDDWIL